jgi:hypothetical protein
MNLINHEDEIRIAEAATRVRLAIEQAEKGGTALAVISVDDAGDLLSEIETLKGERDEAKRHADERLEAVIEADRFNGENYIRAEAAEARATRAEEALKALEAANEAVAATRPQAAYDAMVAVQADELIALDDARRDARAALQPQPQEPK